MKEKLFSFGWGKLVRTVNELFDFDAKQHLCGSALVPHDCDISGQHKLVRAFVQLEENVAPSDRVSAASSQKWRATIIARASAAWRYTRAMIAKIEFS